MHTIRDRLREGAGRLPGDDARREAEILLAHALARPRAWLIAHADDMIDIEHGALFDALIARRAEGEPVAYLTGVRGFHDIELRVTPSVLVPRPETEVLVELALQRIPRDADYAVADLGTGSGAIALAIANARPGARVVATDISDAALAVARGNALRLGLGHVEFRQGSWCDPLAGERFDVIASNPPYVAAGDPYLHEGDLRFEPPLALSPGTDGLSALRMITRQAVAHLRDGGWLLLEHGYDQGAAARALLVNQGYLEVFTEHDLEGRERVSAGRKAMREIP